MRTVTFSAARVRKALQDDFVCYYTNTKGDSSAGASFSHAPNDPPGPCGRGAGRQNVQSIFMTPAGEIFHVATGFLSAGDLLAELRFAANLFAEMLKDSKRRNAAVVVAHRKRLKELGFTQSDLSAPDNRLNDMLLTGPNPGDFGINVPKPQDFGFKIPVRVNGVNLFQDIARQRVLKDHKFVMKHPLMTESQFQRDPGELVGRHRSFFGTNSAFNGIGDQVNRALGGRLPVKSK